MKNAFMARAIELALANIKSGKGGPFGAVVTKGHQIVAEASNSVTVTNDPTAHAEVNAIRAACQHLKSFELRGCDLYTSCEPCPMCLGAIYWSRLDHVYYAGSTTDAAAAGFDDSFIYDELSRESERRRVKLTQLMRDESLVVFDAWRAFEGRIDY